MWLQLKAKMDRTSDLDEYHRIIRKMDRIAEKYLA